MKNENIRDTVGAKQGRHDGSLAIRKKYLFIEREKSINFPPFHSRGM